MSDESLDLVVRIAMESQGFQQQVSTINRQMQVLQTEFQAAGARLKDFEGNTEGLKIKAENLAKQMDLQKQKVGLYADSLLKSKDNLEKNSQTTEKLLQELEKARKAYEDNVKAVGKNSEESKRLKQELDDLEKRYQDSLKIINNNVRAIDNYTIKMNQATKVQDDLANQLVQTNSKIENQNSVLSQIPATIDNLDRKLEILQMQYQNTTVKFDRFGKTTESLKTKSDALSKQMEVQKQKVETLTEAFEKSAVQKGQDEKATQNLHVQMLQAQTSMLKLERELEQTNDAIEKQSTKWGQLSTKLTQIGDKAKQVGASMSSFGASMSMYVTAPLVAIGAASTKMAMDAIESENLFTQSMGKMAESARKWSENLSDRLGLNEYAVRKNVATFNVMIESMGIATDKSYLMAKGLTQLAYDMSSFYNLKPEQAFEKLRSGISGETEPLKILGINLNESMVKAYAFKAGIAATGKELTEQQKVLARYGLIMELTQKAQGDLARTMDSPANKARILKEKVAELSIEIGNALLPIVESIMAVAKPIVEWFAKLNPGLLRFVVIIGMMVATIGPIIAIVGNITSAVGGLSTFLAGFNITGAKTTAIVLGVVAALIALAAIIAVLTGKTGEIERTFKAIGTSTQSIPQGVSIPHYARGGVHGGGLAITDEEGGELKYLPNKTVIVPHDISMEMARNMGKQSQPVVQNITVMVQAHELQQMADVVQLFENLKQTARAR